MGTPPLKLPESGSADVNGASAAPQAAADLRSLVLKDLRAAALTDPQRRVMGRFEALARKIGVKWYEVYEALLSLRQNGLDLHLEGF